MGPGERAQNSNVVTQASVDHQLIRKWLGGDIRLGTPTGSGNVVTKLNVENRMSPNCLDGLMKVGSKPKVVMWSPVQVLNT